jgi:hypothetical protein
VISLLAAMAVIAFADPTHAAEGGATPAAAAPAKSNAKPERVCWDEKPTGSHFPQHYCATREELERRAQQDKDALDNHARIQPQGGLKPN